MNVCGGSRRKIPSARMIARTTIAILRLRGSVSVMIYMLSADAVCKLKVLFVFSPEGYCSADQHKPG